MMRAGLWGLGLLLVCLALYVRLAPSQPDRWHVAPQAQPAGDYQGIGGFLAVREGVPADSLARVTQVALATPRTRLLAGSADSGRVTFVTRSAFWGFPDYTTADLTGDTLRIYGRLRFGWGDLGVNAARVRGWLDQLGL